LDNPCKYWSRKSTDMTALYFPGGFGESMAMEGFTGISSRWSILLHLPVLMMLKRS
jgi:hypothetical protein